MSTQMLDQQPPATTITIADAAQALGATLMAVLLWVWRQLVTRVDGHDDAIEAHDDQLQALEVQQARTQERHDALVGTVERIERKVNNLPGEIVELLTTRRDS